MEGVTPEIDCGRFPAKRVVGDLLPCEANVFGDGHDLVRARAVVSPRKLRQTGRQSEMTALGNDHWTASFSVVTLGFYEFTVMGEVDHFLTWRRDLKKREGGTHLDLPLKTGALLMEATASRASKGEDARLRALRSSCGSLG